MPMKTSSFDHIKKYFGGRKKPSIQEIVREPTAGGVVFRRNKKGDVEFLLYQDARDRWTIPKGHVEPGETAQAAAKREVGEEAGLKNIEVCGWLGKINFRYRRLDKLVLISQQVYLMKALDPDEKLQKEDWMNGLKWFTFHEALDEIEYEDIGKLILLAMKRIRQENL
ncbi:NUDIX domain-containing protein [Candidatus Saccharibacteria bacterium oral taxon 488]|nr:NUDIX domain-containing protein [Candidatus Saccharibacteria bacterium oral taxon 488]